MIYNTFDNNCSTNSIKQKSSIMNKHEDLSDCSSQSVLCAMDRFIKSVNTMNETVMVPCRLLNIEVSDKKDGVPKLLKESEDPYTFYTLLNNAKNDLMWGPSSNDEEDDDIDDNDQYKRHSSKSSVKDQWSSSASNSAPNAASSTTAATTTTTKGHFRRQSTLSMISVASSASDDSDAGDSGLEAEESLGSVPEDSSKAVFSDLKAHLTGLHSCLSDLTDTARFITRVYQEEVVV